MTLRFCSRCHKELTDAVSLDLGVEPICRGIDNDVLANVMPVNVNSAKTIATRILATVCHYAPETQTKMVEVATEVLGTFLIGADMRPTVKRIDWALSFHQTEMSRNDLLALMIALGYAGLAAICSNTGSVTPCTLTLVGTRVVVSGTVKNKHAATAFKSIPGWFFGVNGEGVKVWSFPAKAAVAVVDAVKVHYPASKIPDGFLSAAANAVLPTPVELKVEAPAPTPKPSSKVTITALPNGWTAYQTPFNGAFIAELKQMVFWKNRTWDGATKCWAVAPAARKIADGIVEKHFPGSIPVAAVAA